MPDYSLPEEKYGFTYWHGELERRSEINHITIISDEKYEREIVVVAVDPKDSEERYDEYERCYGIGNNMYEHTT